VLDVMVQGVVRMLKFEDREVQKIAIAALGSTAFESDEERTLVRDSGVLPLVYKLLDEDDDTLLLDALRVFSEMTSHGSGHSLKQYVIDLGTLRVLPSLMKKKAKSSSVIQNSCRLIRNVMEGNEDQKEAVISNGLLTLIVKIIQTGDSEIQYNCSWALCNLVANCTKAQFLSLLAEKPIAAFSVALRDLDGRDDYYDPNTRINVLTVIDKLLSTVNSNQMNTFKNEAREAGLIRHLKKMRKNKDEEVRGFASDILSEYFTENDEEEANETRNNKEKAKKTVQKRKR
ncbi:hypothetical protein PMAYCL1PPCAC_01571, partial [Pristionchus mayeri]